MQEAAKGVQIERQAKLASLDVAFRCFSHPQNLKGSQLLNSYLSGAAVDFIAAVRSLWRTAEKRPLLRLVRQNAVRTHHGIATSTVATLWSCAGLRPSARSLQVVYIMLTVRTYSNHVNRYVKTWQQRKGTGSRNVIFNTCIFDVHVPSPKLGA